MGVPWPRCGRPVDELYEESWEVDRLLARRPSARGGFEYLVAWVDYGSDGDTWEHQDNIIDRSLVKAFDDSFDLRVMLVWRRLRSFLYEALCEGKEAVFDKKYTFHAGQISGVGFSEVSRGGPRAPARSGRLRRVRKRRRVDRPDWACLGHRAQATARRQLHAHDASS